MCRVHLFEWEDQPWLPRVFRDFITDQLRYTHSEAMRQPVNAAIARRLARLLVDAGTTRIIDLCAGAGGPVGRIAGILSDDFALPVRVVITDLFPNVAAFTSLEAGSAGRITARFEPTSAADVPEELWGVRTVFTAFHHFRPPEAARILADAVRKRAPIAVFEPLERTVRMVALVGAMSFIRGFTHAHRVGRLTLGRALVTYVLPLAPAMFAWDGAVSACRTYTADEMLALARSVTTGEYHWEAGRFDVSGPFGPMPTTFLLGAPGSQVALRRRAQRVMSPSELTSRRIPA